MTTPDPKEAAPEPLPEAAPAAGQPPEPPPGPTYPDAPEGVIARWQSRRHPVPYRRGEALPPLELAVRIGAFHAEAIGRTAASWTKAMVSELGESIDRLVAERDAIRADCRVLAAEIRCIRRAWKGEHEDGGLTWFNVENSEIEEYGNLVDATDSSGALERYK